MIRYIPVFIIAAITFITYFPSLLNDFTTWDDPDYITQNNQIKNLSLNGIKEIFCSTHRNQYKPLTFLTFAVEYHFVGLKPFLYHLDNLLLHVFNCVLVYWFIFLLSNNIGVAALTALFFGIHPLHVESVAWATERKDVLFGFFFLVSLIAYFYYRKGNSPLYYWLSILSIALSLITKQQAILFVFVLVLFDCFYFKKFNKKVLLETIPFLLLFFLFLPVLFSNASEGKTGPGSLGRVMLSGGITVCYETLWYIYKLFFPVKLSCLYPHPLQTGGLVAAVFFFSPIILMLSGYFIWLSKRYTAKIIIAGLFFLINILVPLFSSSFSTSIVFDRYEYIPSIGLLYILSEAIVRWYNKVRVCRSAVRPSLIIVMFLLGGFLIFQTWTRCEVWKNGETLFRDAVSKFPGIPVAQVNLGNILKRKGSIDEAIAHYRIAWRLNPSDAFTNNNLGAALTDKGMLDEAIDHFRQALRSNPRYVTAYLNLGIALKNQGKFQDAAHCFRTALALQPGCVSAKNSLEMLQPYLPQ